MKFIHAADIHLDSRVVALRSFYAQERVCLSKLQQRAFTSLIDLAIDEDVDFMLLAGDLFDSNWKDYGVGLFFIQQIKRLKCPTYYIRGNHDSENRLIKSLPYPEDFHIFDSFKPQTMLLDDLKLAIHGQSYSHYHIEEDLAAGYPKALPGYFNIGLLHTSGDKRNGELPYAPYDGKLLHAKGYDYWALGHLHQNQILSENPAIVYSGTLQGRHIKETGMKGCYVISVDEKEVKKIAFKRLSCLQWEKINIEMSSITNESEMRQAIISGVKKCIDGKDVEILIVRFFFMGENQLKKTISENTEHWANAIYCWLEEISDKKIFIEKLIDKSTLVQDAQKNENPLVEHLFKHLEEKVVKKSILENFSTEYAAIKERMPKEILDPNSENESSEDLQSQIKSFLEAKFLETL